MRIGRVLSAVLLAMMLSLALVQVAGAHPHVVHNPHHDQVLANGQNHPGFVADAETGMYNSCAGTAEPAGSGPAGYGLETAHHGPDASPGKADGCYSTEGTPQDNNPAID